MSLTLMRKPLVALAGKSGSGKSTLAEALAQLFDVPRDSFAAPIRWALQELGVKAPYPRRLMQHIGSLLRDYDQDHFVKLLEERNPSVEYRGLIIDDLRFENEFRWAKERGFLTVYLAGSFKPLDGAEASHVSETALSPHSFPFDVVLPAGTSVAYRVSAVVQALRRHEAEAEATERVGASGETLRPLADGLPRMAKLEATGQEETGDAVAA